MDHAGKRINSAFERLASFVFSWYACSLDRGGDSPESAARSLSEIALDEVIAAFRDGAISLEDLERFSKPIRGLCERTFRSRSDVPLISFQEGLSNHRFYLAFSMLTPQDREVAQEVLRSDANPSKDRLQEILNCSLEELEPRFWAAWGRISDMLPNERLLGDADAA